MKISVALCTYNGQRFLGEQLRSIEEQTRLPDELVVCDDASRDDTLAILRDFANRSQVPTQIVVNERNIGSNLNFSKAITLCSGDIILLCDQDDLWNPDKVAVHEHESCRGDNAVVFSDGDVIDEEGTDLDLSLWEHHKFVPEICGHRARPVDALSILRRNVVTGAAMSFRSDLRRLALPISAHGMLIHDGWIAALGAVQSQVQPVPRRLIKYRRHPDQQVGFKPPAPSQVTDQANVHAMVGVKWVNQWKKKHLLLNTILERVDASAAIGLTAFNPGEVERLRRYVEHLEFRIQLPVSAGRRVSGVMREMGRDSYRLYSKGWKSVANDLVGRRK